MKSAGVFTGLLVLLLMLGCSSNSNVAGGGGGGTTNPPPTDSWSEPDCTTVSGTDYVAYSLNQGADLVDSGNHTVPPASVFSFGLVATGIDTLVASIDQQLLRSVDAGCTWTQMALVDTFGIVNLLAADNDAVFAYTNEDLLLFKASPSNLVATQPPSPISSLGFNPAQPGTVRMAAAGSQQLYESTDDGVTWSPIGISPAPGLVNYFTAFDSNDLNHLLRGTTRLDSSVSGAGVWVSFDGGTNWAQSGGLDGLRLNGFVGAFSPNDGDVVWLLALDVNAADLSRRKVYRSTDGGQTFAPVISGAGDVVFNNGTRLFPHTSNPNLLAFSITDPQAVSVRQTHLYLYDAATETLAIGDHPYENIGEVWAIAFNPEHEDNFFFTKTFQVIQEQ